MTWSRVLRVLLNIGKKRVLRGIILGVTESGHIKSRLFETCRDMTWTLALSYAGDTLSDAGRSLF